MTLTAQRVEVGGTVNRLLDALSLTITSQTGREGIALRQKIGSFRSDYISNLMDRTFAVKLLDCFTTARQSNAKLSSFVNIHNVLFAETPVGDISEAIVLMGIVFCLSAESRLISLMSFSSRDDVENMMKVMKVVFDTARDLAADGNNSSAYQSLTFLAGSLTNHLDKVARPLPRMVTFNMATTMPALALSNRIYYTAERWEEIINENKTINPAFCQRDIVGLAS